MTLRKDCWHTWRLSDIFILGYVSDGELAWLTSTVLSILYPSHYEGFCGLPVLEGIGLGSLHALF